MLQKITHILSRIKLFACTYSSKQYVIIVDGPSALQICKMLAHEDGKQCLTFIPSVHYLAKLDRSSPALELRLGGWTWSALLQALFCYPFKRLSKPESLPDGLTGLINEKVIGNFIKNKRTDIASVIVFNERNPAPAYAVSSAKQYGITSACIQHGAVVANYFPVQVDLYYTWTDYYSQLFTKHVKELQCLTVGRLAYKMPAKTDVTSSATPLIVLQPANVSIDENELLDHFKELIDVCYDFYPCIALRPHPSDNIISQIKTHIGHRRFIINHGDLGEALAKHKVTISLYSTVLYEAPLFGSLPIQFLKATLNDELMERCVINTKNTNELQQALQNIQQPGAFERQLAAAKQFSAERLQTGSINNFYQTITSTDD